MEPVFHENSYGYRPNRSAHDALAVARKRCWRRDWVIDLDIKGFFDNLDHDLMMRAVEQHIKESWVLLYIKRWLQAPVESEGEQIERTKGTPHDCMDAGGRAMQEQLPRVELSAHYWLTCLALP